MGGVHGCPAPPVPSNSSTGEARRCHFGASSRPAPEPPGRGLGLAVERLPEPLGTAGSAAATRRRRARSRCPTRHHLASAEIVRLPGRPLFPGRTGRFGLQGGLGFGPEGWIRLPVLAGGAAAEAPWHRRPRQRFRKLRRHSGGCLCGPSGRPRFAFRAVSAWRCRTAAPARRRGSNLRDRPSRRPRPRAEPPAGAQAGVIRGAAIRPGRSLAHLPERLPEDRPPAFARRPAPPDRRRRRCRTTRPSPAGTARTRRCCPTSSRPTRQRPDERGGRHPRPSPDWIGGRDRSPPGAALVFRCVHHVNFPC